MERIKTKMLLRGNQIRVRGCPTVNCTLISQSSIKKQKIISSEHMLYVEYNSPKKSTVSHLIIRHIIMKIKS